MLTTMPFLLFLKLIKLRSRLWTFIVGDVSDDLKKQIKNKIPDDPRRTMGLSSVVLIATAAKYDLATNIDVTDGLTKCAECVVENIDYRVHNSTKPSIIWVSFPHLDIGRKQRRENAYLYKGNVNRNWAPVLEVTLQFRINKKVKYKFFGDNFHLDLLLSRLFTVVKVAL